MAHLSQQLRLLNLHGINLALLFFKVVTHRRQCRVGHGAGGPALVGITATGQRRLGDGLGFFRRFVGAGVDQNHFQRRVLKHALKSFWVDKAHGQQHRMHRDGDAQSNLKRTESLKRGGQFHGSA